jgi:transposase
VPQDHPLRAIRRMTAAALLELGTQFDEMYAKNGRPSIAPEKLLRALLLQVLFGWVASGDCSPEAPICFQCALKRHHGMVSAIQA